MTATSLSTFERCDISTFRLQLCACFASMLQLSKRLYESYAADQRSRSPRARRRHVFDISNSSSSECSAPAIVQYDHATIDQCLDGMKSNLLVLFQNHDSSFARRDNSSSQLTALEEIISALLNPTIIPLACAGPVIQFLVKAYVEDESLASSATASNLENVQPHQTALKKALWTLVCRMPQLSLSHLIVPYIRGAMKLSPPDESSDNISGFLDVYIVNRMIDMYNADAAGRCIQFILQMLPHTRFEYFAVSLLIKAIIDIDNADVLLMKVRYSERKTSKMANGKTILSLRCSRCQIQSQQKALPIDDSVEVQSRRVPKTASLSDLHDANMGGDDFEEEEGIIIKSDSADNVERISLSPRLRDYDDDGRRVSMKRVMKSTSDNISPSSDKTCACLCYTDLTAAHVLSNSDRGNNTHARCTVLPIKMVRLRSNLYRALLSVIKFQLSWKSLDETIKHRADTKLLDRAVCIMKIYPTCAAARLSAVLIADVRGIENGFLPLFNKLLQCSGHPYANVNRDTIRVYSELVVELAICDDPKTFWKVFAPLLNRALQQYDESHDGAKYRLTILRGISYILINRRQTLTAVDSSKVRSYITRLSLSFGCQSFWIHTQMSHEEKKEIIHTLQAIGVLGMIFQEESDGDSSFADHEFLDSLSRSEFPFSIPTSLRDAVGRMGPHVGCNRFLSSLDARFELPEDDNGEVGEAKQRTESLSEVVPLLDYLDDDLIRRIFSYLTHRKLAKVTGVCRSWRSLGNDPAIWHRLYRSRFKIRREVDIITTLASPTAQQQYAAKEEVRDWRRLFITKWMAERRLRSSFSKCGKWKHKTCEYVGCLAVLRSKAMYEKHLKKHRSDTAKRILKEEAAAVRKRKRDEAKVAQDERKKRRKKTEKQVERKNLYNVEQEFIA